MNTFCEFPHLDPISIEDFSDNFVDLKQDYNVVMISIKIQFQDFIRGF